MIALMLVLFIVLLILGVPIAFSTGLATMTYVLDPSNGVPTLFAAQRMYGSMDSFSLLAIPLFMLAGDLMNGGGITKKIVDLASVCVGHIRGSLGHVTILASMLFASMSGAGAAACASVGSMMIPAMKEKNYDDGYAVGVTCCAAVMGPIIPPSIAFVVYSSLSGDSIGELFLAGVIPGIIMGLCMMLLAWAIAKKGNYPVESKSSWQDRWKAIKNSIPAIMMPVIIMGGILSGFFTATEAGCIGCVYGMLVGFLTKQLKLADLPRLLLNSAKTTAMILFIMGTSQVLGWILNVAQMPKMLSAGLMGITTSPVIMLIIMMAIVLFLGCFMVDAAVMLIMTPLFLPIVDQLGINGLVFAIVINIVAIAGGVTPPVGNLLYIASGIAGTPVTKAVKGMLPFLFAIFLAIAICIAFPWTCEWLPSILA